MSTMGLHCRPTQMFHILVLFVSCNFIILSFKINEIRFQGGSHRGRPANLTPSVTMEKFNGKGNISKTSTAIYIYIYVYIYIYMAADVLEMLLFPLNFSIVTEGVKVACRPLWLPPWNLISLILKLKMIKLQETINTSIRDIWVGR